MVGGVGDGFAHYLKTLRFVAEHDVDRAKLVEWLKNEFQLEQSYAKNVVTIGTGCFASVSMRWRPQPFLMSR